MAKPKKRHSLARRMFRWFRISVLLTILALVIAGIYLNVVGLPGFLKRPLVAKLLAEGVRLDFSRMRMRWYRGIVVDHATFTFLKYPLSPSFSAQETELDIDLRSLGNSRLKLNSVTIEKANLNWPVSTNRALSLSNITTRIYFDSAEQFHLREFTAQFAGARITLAGSVTNLSAIRALRIFHPPKTDLPKRGLTEFADAMEKIHFTGTPALRLFLSGDGADLFSFKGEGLFTVPKAETPWGKGENLQLTAQLRNLGKPAENNFIQLKLTSVETPWGSGSNLNCIAKLSSPSTNSGVLQTDLKIFSKQILAKQKDGAEIAHAASIQLSAHSSQAWTNLIPTIAAGKITFTHGEIKQGSAASGEISFSGSTNSAEKSGDATWAAWQRAEPFLLNWDAELSDIVTPKLKILKAACVGTWKAPELKVSRLEARLYGGELKAVGELNVATRAASLQGTSSFEVLKISPLLTPFGQEWLDQFSWDLPPQLSGELSVILPAWTNAAPNWRAEVLPSLALHGKASVGTAAFRKVTASSASAEFIYTNRTWTLPHLRVDRPEGGADLTLVANDETRTFHWHIVSEIDPAAIRPLLNEKQIKVFDDFKFSSPPRIKGELHGRWQDLTNLAGSGEVLAQHFSFRSNAIDKVTCSLLFTNQQLEVSGGRLEQDQKFISAQRVAWNFPGEKLFFTNIYSTVDPYLVTRLIGPKVAEAIEPYKFAAPPAVRLNGSMSIGDIDDTDLHFDVDGTLFDWKYFHADRLTGRVDWVGKTLLLTNIQSSTYHGGHVSGWSYFEFTHTNGADYKFNLAARDIDLRYLIKSLNGKTNRLEGLVDAQMTLTAGNTRNWDSLEGTGKVNLRDGLVWDVPIFGIFSPFLNALVHGAGNSRAREASATFLVTNGIIYSDDLEIRAPMIRMRYRGGVDFQQRVEARVEVELLHDAWVIGPLVSLALTPISKILAWQVTGNLSHPVTEPVYIPNFLLMTLRPFHTLMKPLKKIITPEKEPPAPKPDAPDK